MADSYSHVHLNLTIRARRPVLGPPVGPPEDGWTSVCCRPKCGKSGARDYIFSHHDKGEDKMAQVKTFQVLSQDEIQRIHLTTLELLERTAVAFREKEAQKVNFGYGPTEG